MTTGTDLIGLFRYVRFTPETEHSSGHFEYVNGKPAMLYNFQSYAMVPVFKVWG